MRLAISFMHSRWVRVRPHRGTIEPSNHLQRRSLLAREYGRWRMETPKPGYPRKFCGDHQHSGFAKTPTNNDCALAEYLIPSGL
jgi:hypothetical protein